MITFLIGAAILAAWVLSLLVHPFGRCWLCRGGRVRVKGRKARKCRARQRLGSRTVHRVRRQVAASWRTPKGGGNGTS